jgi:hypothetical protein
MADYKVERWDGDTWRGTDPAYHDTKASANKQAKFWRKRGWKIRIVKRNPARSRAKSRTISLKGFTGKIKQLANGALSIQGKGRKK